MWYCYSPHEPKYAIHVYINIHTVEKKSLFTLNYCFVPVRVLCLFLQHSAMSWSVVCDRGATNCVHKKETVNQNSTNVILRHYYYYCTIYLLLFLSLVLSLSNLHMTLAVGWTLNTNSLTHLLLFFIIII